MDLFTQPQQEDTPEEKPIKNIVENENKNEDQTIENVSKDQDEFAIYNELTAYHRRCLPTTNFWHLVNGNEPILVPISDTYYYANFTDEDRRRAIAIYNNKFR